MSGLWRPEPDSILAGLPVADIARLGDAMAEHDRRKNAANRFAPMRPCIEYCLNTNQDEAQARSEIRMEVVHALETQREGIAGQPQIDTLRATVLIAALDEAIDTLAEKANRRDGLLISRHGGGCE